VARACSALVAEGVSLRPSSTQKRAESYSMNVGIVAGEISGNLLGAGLIHALREKQSDIHIEGIGGPDMIAAGCHSFYDMERLAVMGLIEPLGRLPELIRIRRHLYRHFAAQKPDVFIGIDSPDFNIGLEFKLRKAGIPIVHYGVGLA
jgi:lipid-A-disaccharide synthase